MTIAFDLDGTLIDTRMAVKAAYKLAGIDMPDWAWGLAWQEWLPKQCGMESSRFHKLKNQHYPRMLERYAEVLPLYQAAIELRAPVLTGASRQAVESILKLWPGINVQGCGMMLAEKIIWLNAHAPGHYVDDNEFARQEVAKNTQWTPLSPEEAMSSILKS